MKFLPRSQFLIFWIVGSRLAKLLWLAQSAAPSVAPEVSPILHPVAQRIRLLLLPTVAQRIALPELAFEWSVHLVQELRGREQGQ